MKVQYISLIFFLLAILSKYITKSWTNPSTIFLIIWSVITFLSSFNLYGLPEVSIYYYTLILIGGIIFFTGFIIVFALQSSRKKSNDTINYIIHYKALELCAVFCLIFLCYTLVTNGITVSSAFDLAGTQELLKNTSGNTGVLNFISLIIVTPMYTVINLFACMSIWQKNKSKFLIYEDIILVLGRIISSGGRQAMIESSIFLIISYIYSKKKNILTLKRKLEITLLIVILICIFMMLSSLRTDNIVKTLILDITMEPNMLQLWGNYVQNTGIYGFGMSSLMGFIYVPFYLLKNMGLMPSIPYSLQTIYELNQQPIIEWVNLGPQVYANAYVSSFWNLFLDGRIYGIIIGMFLFGLIATWIYSKLLFNKTLLNLCYYSLIVYCIIYTFGDLEFSKINICLVFIYLIFFIKKGDTNVKKDY